MIAQQLPRPRHPSKLLAPPLHIDKATHPPSLTVTQRSEILNRTLVPLLRAGITASTRTRRGGSEMIHGHLTRPWVLSRPEAGGVRSGRSGQGTARAGRFGDGLAGGETLTVGEVEGGETILQ